MRCCTVRVSSTHNESHSPPKRNLLESNNPTNDTCSFRNRNYVIVSIIAPVDCGYL